MAKDSRADILVSYYGDDFTGSTDVMESLTLNGIPAVMFLNPPSPDEVENFRLKVRWAYNPENTVNAFGVAGISRSLSPSAMDRELHPIFEKIKQIPSRFFHYKICSTFDSAPSVGNIGHATDIAMRYFPSAHIPLVVGAPFLNRFVIFSNLFARADGITYRLDRHPTMSRHPVTPMHESDLRLHLATLTKRGCKAVDYFSLEDPGSNLLESVNRFPEGEFILFDTISLSNLTRIGKLLLSLGQRDSCQLVVGSSGVEFAIASALQEAGLISRPPGSASVGKAEAMIVMAGSCSPVTANQLNYMVERGHADIRLNTIALMNDSHRNSELERVEAEAVIALNAGKVPLIYSAKGNTDAAIAETRSLFNMIPLQGQGWDGGGNKVLSEVLGVFQGQLIRSLLTRVKRCRVAVAGGDTSGYVMRSLQIRALEVLMPVAPGAPLCVAHSDDKLFDGLQISLKGGQNGGQNFFDLILNGSV